MKYQRTATVLEICVNIFNINKAVLRVPGDRLSRSGLNEGMNH